MTQVSDDLALGPVPRRKQIFVSGSNPAPNAYGVGPAGALTVYDVVPQANATMASAVNLKSAGTITMTANGTAVTSSTLADGNSAFVLDVPRGISIASTADLSGVTFTMTAVDAYGAALTNAMAGPNNGTSTFDKIPKAVLSIGADKAANPVTVQTADVFGLPVAVTDRGYVASAYFAGTAMTTVTTADTTSPATSTTKDVRGSVSTTKGTSDGKNRLVVATVLSASQIGPNAPTSGTTVYGVTQA